MTEKTRQITMTETQVVLLLQTMDQIGVTKRVHIKAISDLIVDLESAEKAMAGEKAATEEPNHGT
jgi:hypothetical protein